MLEELLPASVTVREAYADLPADPGDISTVLLPQEAALVKHAVPGRYSEFATVRTCARRALGELGLPPAPLLKGERGAPRWPAGVVGSMTHCRGYRAAAVARATHVTAIGIDAEPATPLTDRVLASISSPGERDLIRELADRRPDVPWCRMVFSAKESVFKAWHPLTGRELGFLQAQVDVDADAGTFRARLRAPGPPVEGQTLRGFDGRWLCRAGLIITAIALTSDRHSAPSTRG
ncbi:4'-phosphopantetheinyl transferase [Streptomyces microflavus]|uniref:4'-phosphopantetheinyl transferase family protein n=1 Tax=Streptomyces microflavus TaxID=1919 RepID=UPI00381DF7CD